MTTFEVILRDLREQKKSYLRLPFICLSCILFKNNNKRLARVALRRYELASAQYTQTNKRASI